MRSSHKSDKLIGTLFIASSFQINPPLFDLITMCEKVMDSLEFKIRCSKIGTLFLSM
jgi:hypothetical protein